MEFTDKQAIYLQIVDYVSDCIIAGKWQANERIPSVRELAVELLVNPNTVMRAYEHLQTRDIVYTKRGVGLHVTAEAFEKIINTRRDNFITIEMPGLFNKLDQLNITFGELQQYYNKYKETHKNI